jgi:hypothetical protein
MSLLAQMNQPNGNLVNGAPQYYFALDSSPANPEVTAPAFVATGVGEPNNDGRFIARGDAAAGAPALPFQMRTQGAFALQQWNIGMENAPAGANSGNDMAIFAYDDNGVFLGKPLAIDRSSGLVSMSEDAGVGGTLTAGDAVVAGTAASVGGGAIQVNGTLGLSSVYDAVYNRPNAGVEVVLSTFNNVGAPTGPLVPYTPTNSGLFTLTMEVRTDATGYAWTNGTNIISGYLANMAPPFALLSDSFTTCDSLANPGGAFGYPSGFPMGVYVKDIVAVINLTAGVAYQPTISIGGAFNLGTTGGIRFFIQPLLA